MKTDIMDKALKRAMRGDKQAFAKLCEQQGPFILYHCIKQMGNQQDGEDAAQEVFIQMQKSISSLKSPEAYIVWVRKIIVHTCNKLRRGSKGAAGLLPIDDYLDQLSESNVNYIPEEYVTNCDKNASLLAIIDDLPEKIRTCIYYFYLDHLKISEIAEVLEVSEDVVKQRLKRGRDKIRESLVADYPGIRAEYSAVPMVALSRLFYEEMAVLAPKAAVLCCMESAGVAIGGLAQAAGVSAAVKMTLVSVAAAGIIGTAILVPRAVNRPAPEQSFPPAASHTSQEAAPEQGAGEEEPFVPEMQATSPSASLASLPSLSEEGGTGAPTGITYQFYGWAYLSDPATQRVSTEFGLAGVTIELWDKEGTECLQTVETTEDGSFNLNTAAAGEYRIRAVLPAGVQFVASGGTQPGNTRQNTAWLQNSEGGTVFAANDEARVHQNILVPVFQQTQITGRVEMKGSGSLDGIRVDLMDTEERILASATTDSAGRYTIANPPVAAAGEYTLRIFSPSTPYAPAQDKTSIRLTPGKSAEAPTLQLLGAGTPRYTLALAGGNCGCGHLNPTHVEMEFWDGAALRQWRILNDAGQPAASGESLDALNNLLASGQLTPGSYQLWMTVTDPSGGTVEDLREIQF